MVVQQARHRHGVGHDPGHVGGGRERADLQGPVGVADELCLEVGEVDVAVGVLADRDHVGDALPPRQLVGMVLEGAHEHDGALAGGDLVGQVVAVLELARQAQAEHADQAVDGVGRAAAAEQHGVLVGGADAAADDVAGLFPEPGGLQPGAGGLGVGVGVEGQDDRAEVVLDEREGAPRRRVVRVDDRAGAEGAIHHLVEADHRVPDVRDEVVGAHGPRLRRGVRDPGGVPRLLLVHHTPSPAVQSLLEKVREGASHPDLAGVELVVRPALAATAVDVLEADGYLLGTPANFGYMSGALKHFFDLVYYPCLDATVGRPYGLYVHGNDDTAGAVRAVTTITAGLRWELAQPVLEVTGTPDGAALDAAWELGAALGATLATAAD